MNIKVTANIDAVPLKYRSLLTIAISYMGTVIGSKEFQFALRSLIENSNNLEGELSRWKDHEFYVIYYSLFDDNLEINLTIQTYHTSKNVIGYGYPSTKIIYLNTKYLSQYNEGNLEHLKKIGSNLLHEHSHDCGFKHDFKSTKRRKNSVSYLLNEAYEQAIDELYGKKTMVTVCYRSMWSLWLKKKCYEKEVVVLG